MRQDLAFFRLFIKKRCALRLWKEIHGLLQIIPEVNVGCNTDNLVHSRVISRSWAKVLPNRVFTAKELLRERLVDHGYRPRAVVLVSDRPPQEYPISESLEKSRRHTSPTG